MRLDLESFVNLSQKIHFIIMWSFLVHQATGSLRVTIFRSSLDLVHMRQYFGMPPKTLARGTRYTLIELGSGLENDAKE